MGLLALLVGVAAFALQPATTTAAVGINTTMNYQGRLLSAGGAIVPDGVYNMQFKLYQDGDGTVAGNTAGTPAGTLLWTESWLNSASQGVTVRNGYFAVNLGSVTPLTPAFFNQNTLYLSINIGGTAGTASYDGEMLPMKKLTSSPYAQNAGLLGGLSAAQFLQLAPTAAQADATTNSSLFINKTAATGNILQLQRGGADVAVINNNGDLALKGAVNSTTSLAVKTADNAVTVLAVDTVNQRVNLANGTWLSGTDASGTGTINAFKVNANNEIQVGAALNLDGGLLLPADAGQVTLADLPITTAASAGTPMSYSLRVGSANVLTVYGQADGSGAPQNLRVAIGSSITPAYPLDVTGDINSSTALRVGGTQVCTTTGCTAASGSASYIQNGTAQQSANFNIVSTATGSVAARIQGAASGTANILEVADGSGTTRLTVAANGQLSSSGFVIASNGAQVNNQLTVLGVSGTSENLKVIAAPSQSADILQFKNSGGAILGGFNATGQRYSQSGSYTGTMAQGALSANQTYTFPDATGTVCLSTGNCPATGGSGNYIQNQSAAVQSANIKIQSASNTPTATFIGSSGQSVDLLQVYNAGNTRSVAISSQGDLFVNGGSGIYINTSSSVAQFGVRAIAATTIGAVIQGAGGQTADLLQVQNSNGIALSKFDANGKLTSYGTGLTVDNLAVPTGVTSSTTGTAFYYKVTALNTQGETIGSSEVSGSSAATTISWTAVNGATGYRVYRGTATNAQTGYVAVTAPTVSLAGAESATLTTATVPTSTTGTTFVAKVWSGQTADALQIQSSTGTVLSKFDATGGLTLNNSNDLTLQAGAASTNDAGDIVFKNNAGTQLGRIFSSTSGSILNFSGADNVEDLVVKDGSVTISGVLGLGTTNPQAGAALTVVNSKWLTAIDSSGTGYVNMFQVNANNEVQVGSTLNVGGGIVLPADAGQVTLADLPITSASAAGTAQSYTLRVGSSNALTVYGQSDGAGNAQNIRVAIGSSITPGYPLDVTGDINSSSALRVGGNTVCTSTGCTSASGSGNYIQNGTANQVANFHVQSASADSVAGILMGAASQTADLLQLTNSSGTVLSKIDASGNLTSRAITASNTVTLQAGSGLPNDLILRGGNAYAGQPGAIQFQSNNSTVLGKIYVDNNIAAVNISAQGTNSDLRVSDAVTTVRGTALVKGTSGQTNNLLELQNNAGTVLTKFDQNGNLSVPGVSASATVQANTLVAGGTNGGLSVYNNSTFTTTLGASTISGNMVGNQGFEPAFGTYGWNATGSGASITGVQTLSLARSGTGSLNVTTTTSATVNAGAKFVFTGMAANTSYTLNFYARSASGSLGNMVAGYSADGSANVQCMSGQTFNAYYDRYNCTFTTPASVAGAGIAYIYVGQNDAGVAKNYYIDDVQLLPSTNASRFATTTGTVQIGGAVNAPVLLQNASDSTNAFQVLNAAGTSVFNIDSANSGQLTVAGAASLGVNTGANVIVGAGGPVAGQKLTVVPTMTTSIAIVARGASGQTADLLQLQNSAGASLGGFNANGQRYSVSGSFTGTMAQGTLSGNQTYTFPDASGTVCLDSGNCNGATGYIQNQIATNQVASFRINGAGTFGASVNAGGVIQSSSNIIVGSGNSSGAVKLAYSSLGGSDYLQFNYGGNLKVSSSNSIELNPGQGTIVRAGSAASVGLNVTGAASQTADLLQIQNSDNSRSIQVTASGDFKTQGGGIYSNLAYGSFGSQFGIKAGNSSIIGAVIQGEAGQSADLLQFRDSAGVNMARVTSNGEIWGTKGFKFGSNAGTTDPLPGAVAGINAYTNGVVFALRGVYAQTQDLLQIQDSNGTNQLRFTAGSDLRVAGSVIANTTPDIAETIPAAADVTTADVVMADPASTERVVKAVGGYNGTAVGVIADGTSGFIINSHAKNTAAELTGKPLALAGRVQVKITSENGAVKPGDYLTTSSTRPGYAMKATAAGATIGKALGFFDPASGSTNVTTGTVLVFVNLSYYNPTTGAAIQGQDASFTNLFISGKATIAELEVTGMARVAGDLTVGGTIKAQSIELAGHLKTTGTTPTVVGGPGVCGAEVTVAGSDTAGTITITTGATGCAADGELARITFAQAYDHLPTVVTAPANKAAGTTGAYFDADASDASAWSLAGGAALAPKTTYKFTYHVVQ